MREAETGPEFIVQASSLSWSGGRDICMNLVNGLPVVSHTIKRILQNFPHSQVVIAAPAFDEGGSLSAIARSFGIAVRVFYGFDRSPLLRMLAAHDHFLKQSHFCRIDGLNMFFRPSPLKAMFVKASKRNLDCVKFPDAYPSQLTADIYKKSALQKLATELNSSSPYQIHPKYALIERPQFDTDYANEGLEISDLDLQNARQIYKQVYLDPRDAMTSKNTVTADTLAFHYILAREYIKTTDRVLDIACAGGRGVTILAEIANEVIGADLDSKAIQHAHATYGSIRNTTFCVNDITHLAFHSSSFDVVTCFETLEHVHSESCLRELCRVLKPGGFMILSTPQNNLGHIPLNPQHTIEYSLEQLKLLLSTSFETVHLTAIKQGCILSRGNARGANTFFVGRRRPR